MIFKTKGEAIQTLIKSTDIVLDVGFFGQAKKSNDTNWPHRIIKQCACEVYGVDIIPYDPERPDEQSHYFIQSAESFDIPIRFDAIVALDLIEHLPNPGLFLDTCKKHLKPEGRLILTTPNAFNMYAMVEKMTHDEPRVNSDHTCYFNKTTLNQLFQKTGWGAEKIGYIFSIDLDRQTNLKRKFLRAIYGMLNQITPKFLETLIVVAKPNLK